MPYKQYNNNQSFLSFPLLIEVPDDHIVRVISWFIDAISPALFAQINPDNRGASAYDPRMMLKMLLFAYLRNQRSGAQIQRLAEENIPMKWLIGNPDIVPNARTINRFRSAEQTGELIKVLYLQFRLLLQSLKLLDDEEIFIDGTKITADANKYSFVWRRSVERFEPILDEKANDLFNELMQIDPSIDLHSEAADLLARLNEVVDEIDSRVEYLDEVVANERTIPGGSKNKRQRRSLKHLSHLLHNDLIPRKTKYVEANKVFGQRNSFSKTDYDATFMMMKEDPMNNGQTKPGYNIQIATQNQFVLYYDVTQRPTDQRTLIPFLEKIDIPFRYIVADAGYGSQANYEYVLHQRHAVPLIPYTMYLKELSRKYQKDLTKRQNWQYNGLLDRYIDNIGVQFGRVREYDKVDKSTGFVKHFLKYEALPGCNPEQDRLTQTERGSQRTISVNIDWESQKSLVRRELATPDGRLIYGMRKFEVEPVFGNLKRNLKFNRYSVRGLQAVTNETGIVLMAGNLKKLAILINVYPDLLEKMLKWEFICRTFKPEIWHYFSTFDKLGKKRPNILKIFRMLGRLIFVNGNYVPATFSG